MISPKRRKNFPARNIAVTTRTCDDCGKIEEVFWDSVMVGRQRRQADRDYCKKCSYKYRDTKQLRGKNSPFWKGGVSLTKNGYYRINSSGEYLHKVLYGRHVGRKISTEEKVHHIDLNKTNNGLSNLYLCPNKTEHNRCHYSLEKTCLSFLGTKIWFDYCDKSYVLIPTKRPQYQCSLNNILALRKHIQVDKKKRSYEFSYLGNRRHRATHVLVVERMIGRRLNSDELTHHIDGDTLNNAISNLCHMTRRRHKIAHMVLQRLGAGFVKKGIIVFDLSNGIYLRNNL